jgi:hypothetical protein
MLSWGRWGGDQDDWIGAINTVIHLQCLPILQKQTGCLKCTHSASCTPQTDTSASLISVGLSQPCVGLSKEKILPVHLPCLYFYLSAFRIILPVFFLLRSLPPGACSMSHLAVPKPSLNPLPPKQYIYQHIPDRKLTPKGPFFLASNKYLSTNRRIICLWTCTVTVLKNDGISYSWVLTCAFNP